MGNYYVVYKCTKERQHPMHATYDRYAAERLADRCNNGNEEEGIHYAVLKYDESKVQVSRRLP